MPSNKDKVASYLDQDEVKALDELCQENDFSRSQGIIHLIRNHLIENDNSSEVQEIENDYREKVCSLDERILKIEERGKSLDAKYEDLRGVIGGLRDVIYYLQTNLKAIEPTVYPDDAIAAVTGRRVQEAYEWRLGIRKPRGTRILEKLEPYVVIDGQWRKKQVSEHPESVTRFVTHF